MAGEFAPNVGLESGKQIGLSYDQVTSTEVAIGDVQNYLMVADFMHPNKRLLKNANRNNLLLIRGMLTAKTEFSKLFNGKFESGHASENKLVMSDNDIALFPISAKVHRIDFDEGQFVNTTLLSDRRNLL